MIPIMTLDLATAFATFGWAGGGLVLAGLGAVLVALIRDGRAKPEADAENVATPDDLRPAAPLARSGGDSLQLDSALAPACRAEESRRPSSARAALTRLTTPARSATTQEQPGSLALGGGAIGTLVFIEGALVKSNMSSSVTAYWSRAVRCGRVPSWLVRLRKRFSMKASSDV